METRQKTEWAQERGEETHIRRGVIELPELPDVYGVYFAGRKEMKRNTKAAPGSKIIVIHYPKR